MAPADFALLQPDLSYVQLVRSEPLVEPDRPIDHSWFLEDGIASVVATTPKGHETEVGSPSRALDAEIAVPTVFARKSSARLDR